MNHDEAIREQERRIEKDIADLMPNVSDLIPIEDLISDYAIDDQIYQKKIQHIGKKYASIRRTRPDGNCFFRGFVFAYFEALLNRTDDDDIDNLIGVAKSTLDELMKLNYPAVTSEDFCEVFLSVVMAIKERTIETTEQLLDRFNQHALSDYLIVYLRIITSVHLQTHEDTYSNFIVDSPSILEFCKTEVEPMFKESDHLHIVALTTALKVCARIVYMDRGSSDTVNEHDFPDPENFKQPKVHLLYRPGHYDILYTR